MPHFLESSKLELTPDEAAIYRAAADRLREATDTALDLTQPVSVEDWILIRVADAALAGNARVLDQVIEVVELAAKSRRLRS